MAIDVCAHITGTVWKVEVAVGDRVEAEQVLVILESMKMEMPLEAPEAGTVSVILAKPGASVEEGDVLLRLDPATP
jgi:acetyl-CoA carboxylase biotin carboxyl carrier protein